LKLPVLPPVVPIKTWGATKIFAYEDCPRKAQLKYGAKLCPLCFKGTVGFDTPCTKCKKKQVKGVALQRGIDLDEAIAAHVLRRTEDVIALAIHKGAQKIIQGLALDPTSGVKIKHSISLGPDWKPLPKFTKGPWFWGELDVLRIKGKLATVIDWKSGGIDKKTQKIRPNEHYEDQLEIYQLAVLCALPDVERVDASLVFLDAPVACKPEIANPTVVRKMVAALKKKWEGRIKALFADDTFAPRPSDFACRFCDYSKEKGGPCEF
jgi:hypothetical protein